MWKLKKFQKNQSSKFGWTKWRKKLKNCIFVFGFVNFVVCSFIEMIFVLMLASDWTKKWCEMKKNTCIWKSTSVNECNIEGVHGSCKSDPTDTRTSWTRMQRGRRHRYTNRRSATHVGTRTERISASESKHLSATHNLNTKRTGDQSQHGSRLICSQIANPLDKFIVRFFIS